MGNPKNTTLGRIVYADDLRRLQRCSIRCFAGQSYGFGRWCHEIKTALRLVRSGRPDTAEPYPNHSAGCQRILRRGLRCAALWLAILCASASPKRAQDYTEVCIPLTRPLQHSDEHLMWEFADLLRDEFERYLSEVTAYFSCLDAERDRAWREAAEVTRQYGMFLETLRRAPP